MKIVFVCFIIIVCTILCLIVSACNKMTDSEITGELTNYIKENKKYIIQLSTNKRLFGGKI